MILSKVASIYYSMSPFSSGLSNGETPISNFLDPRLNYCDLLTKVALLISSVSTRLIRELELSDDSFILSYSFYCYSAYLRSSTFFLSLPSLV
jgi:hypothetical protein